MCYWVQVKTHDAQVAMKNDQFGFTFVNSKRLLPTHEQSFVLPLQIQQMFFYDFVHNLSWKIIPLKCSKFQWMVGDNCDHVEPTNLTKDMPKIVVVVVNVFACDDN